MKRTLPSMSSFEWVPLTRGSSGGPGCDASRTPSSVRVKFWYLRSHPVSVTFNFNAYPMVADMATHLYIAWSSSFWLAQVKCPPSLLKNWNKLSEIISADLKINFEIGPLTCKIPIWGGWIPWDRVRDAPVKECFLVLFNNTRLTDCSRLLNGN